MISMISSQHEHESYIKVMRIFRIEQLLDFVGNFQRVHQIVHNSLWLTAGDATVRASEHFVISDSLDYSSPKRWKLLTLESQSLRNWNNSQTGSTFYDALLFWLQAVLAGRVPDIPATLSRCKLWVTRLWIIQPEILDFVAGAVWTLSSLLRFIDSVLKWIYDKLSRNRNKTEVYCIALQIFLSCLTISSAKQFDLEFFGG